MIICKEQVKFLSVKNHENMEYWKKIPLGPKVIEKWEIKKYIGVNLRTKSRDGLCLPVNIKLIFFRIFLK